MNRCGKGSGSIQWRPSEPEVGAKNGNLETPGGNGFEDQRKGLSLPNLSNIVVAELISGQLRGRGWPTGRLETATVEVRI